MWSAITMTATALVGGYAWLSTEFVSSRDFSDLAIEIYFDQYYELEDRLERAENDDDEEKVDELEHRIEKLILKICKLEPGWRECPTSS